MKKLAVPFLVLSLAAFGCSSSSSNKDAGGGSGGAGRGGSAGGGTGGSTGGSGGATGGSGGATGGSGGSAGRGGSAGSTATDGGNPDTLMASCTVVTDTTADQNMTLSAADFCTNLLAACAGMIDTTYMAATCQATYTASTRKHCQSYHLCWGVEGGGGGPAAQNPHCGHAQGMGVCAPLADAATGN